jgi:MFS family permease
MRHREHFHACTHASSSFHALAYLGTWMVLLTPTIISLALRIQQIDPQGKGTDLALVLGCGTVFGILAGPFCGSLSDRTTSRFGMRRPWLVGGVIVGTIGMLLIGTAQQILMILVGGVLCRSLLMGCLPRS